MTAINENITRYNEEQSVINSDLLPYHTGISQDLNDLGFRSHQYRDSTNIYENACIDKNARFLETEIVGSITVSGNVVANDIYHPTEYGDKTRSGANIAFACAAVHAAGRGIVRLTGGTFAVTASADFLGVQIDVLPGSHIVKSDAAIITGLNIYGMPDYMVVSCNAGFEPSFTNDVIGINWLGVLTPGYTEFIGGDIKLTTADKGFIFSDMTAGKALISNGTRYVPKIISFLNAAVCFSVFDTDEKVYPCNGSSGFVISNDFNGFSLTGVCVRVCVIGSDGVTSVQIRKNRNGVDIDMLSSNCEITTTYFESNGVVNPDNKLLLTGDLIFIDIDAVNTNPPYGLSVTLELTKE